MVFIWQRVSDKGKRRDDLLVLFVVRASLGNIKSYARSSRVPDDSDAVIGGIEPRDDFREFVVKELNQVVPAYVVIYKRTFDANSGCLFSIRSYCSLGIRFMYNWLMCVSRCFGEYRYPGYNESCCGDCIDEYMGCLYECCKPRMATNKIDVV